MTLDSPVYSYPTQSAYVVVLQPLNWHHVGNNLQLLDGHCITAHIEDVLWIM